MSDNKANPAKIMHQIRSGVRKQEITTADIMGKNEGDLTSVIHMDSDLQQDLQVLSAKISRLVHRITPNMPVAFMEPRLVSRYKFLDKFITPLRRFGNRLFVKWYVDTVSNQQKYLNNDVWFGLNNSIEVISEQNKLITRLAERISILEKEQSNLQAAQDNHTNDYRKFVDQFNQKYTIGNFHYSDFAKRFMASGKDVKRIFSQYIQFFKPTDTVIDIGCGKGYFLELLRENNLKGIGVDTDPKLIDECTEKNLEAYVVEGSEYLLKQRDLSLDAVFFAHVIEHLTVPQKISFLDLCFKKLKKGGVLIIETPNATSGFVMNNLYYLDPTHEKPLFPEALKHLAEMAGFKVVNSYLSEEIILPNGRTEYTEYYNYSLILEK
ncbi:class I SAM-dependent methyltransferase [Paenibacillus sp. GCM10012306]|uniref:class I SAM-dependent methyltransferase n=1 Tax=Paenibacillus sp. GCM10012306 TaxID=3317342 RepID=UPI003616E7D2